MTNRPRLPEGMTPRLLSREQAAAYVGLSPGAFTVRIAGKVSALRLGKRILWDRRALDAYLDRLSGLTPAEKTDDEWLEALDADQGRARP